MQTRSGILDSTDPMILDSTLGDGVDSWDSDSLGLGSSESDSDSESYMGPFPMVTRTFLPSLVVNLMVFLQPCSNLVMGVINLDGSKSCWWTAICKHAVMSGGDLFSSPKSKPRVLDSMS